MNRSSKNLSRLKNILNKREDLWADLESDISDNDNLTISSDSSETSSDENNELLPTSCCLICSILPNLSKINSCPKHLALLTKAVTPTQVVYMMPSKINHCHCRSRSKRHCRSSSSSSSSSRSRYKKRSMTVLSSDTSSQEDLFFSPDVTSQGITDDNQQRRSNEIQPPLSPSLPASSIIKTNMINNLQQPNELLLTPFLHRTKQRTTNEIESLLKNDQNKSMQEEFLQTISPDIIEIDSYSSCSTPPNLDRIVHVKDDGEILSNNDQNRMVISMAQATEKMHNQIYTKPIILLERIRFEN